MTQAQRAIRYAQLLADGCPEDLAWQILQQEQHEQDIAILTQE